MQLNHLERETEAVGIAERGSDSPSLLHAL